MMDEKEHSIRFINSSYDTLFRIPDGGTVEVRFPDRTFTAKCEYLDDYHTKIGDTVFHICEFAEFLEHQVGTVHPEPEITSDEAAWQLSHREYLTLQKTDSGFDYTIYSKNFRLMDGGQLDAPELTMKQAREQILEMHGLVRRNRRAVPFNEVMEKAEAVQDSVLDQLHDLKSSQLQTPRVGKEKAHDGKETR